MWHTIFALLWLCNWTLGLSEDQIFQTDWQTFNLGIPINTFYDEDKIFMISNIGVFSIINSTTGDLIWRFKHHGIVGNTSQIIKLSDDIVTTIFNAEDTHVLVWNISHPVPTIDFQVFSETPIWDVTLNGKNIYTIGYEGIRGYDILNSFDPLYRRSLENVNYGRLFTDQQSNESFAMWETGKETLLASLNNIEKTEQIPKCHVSNVQFLNNEKNSFFCEYQYYEIIRQHHGENLLVAKAAFDSTLLVNSCNGLLIKNDVIEVYDITSSGYSLLKVYENNFLESCTIKAFGFNGNELKVLCVSETEMIHQYVNGSLVWSRDQSFLNISDAIVVNKFDESNKFKDNLNTEEKFNYVTVYLKRIKYNWKRFKEVFQFNNKQDDIFGLQKYLIVLSDNQKIGIFDMENDPFRTYQLNYVIVPDNHIDELIIVEGIPYAVSSGELFKIDITKKALQRPEIGDNELGLNILAEFKAKHLMESNKIQGYKLSGNIWKETWEFCPHDELIISFTKRAYDNSHVAQNGITLADRSVLYKYLIPNVGVVTTLSSAKSHINIRLVNMITGQTYAHFTKLLKEANFSPHNFKIVFEENFIVFTIFSETERDTEVCVIDLFESLTPNLKKSKNLHSYSAFKDAILPSFASQCYVIPGKQIVALAVSNTKNNIAIKEIVFGSIAGQVFSVPKMVLDGRRSGVAGDFSTLKEKKMVLDGSEKQSMSIYFQKYANSIVNKLAYDPVITPHPNNLISHYRDILVGSPEKAFAFTVPTELESTTYCVFIGSEIFVTLLRPSGSFDKLTSSFNTNAVVITISVLILGIFFVLPKARRTMLLNMWSL